MSGYSITFTAERDVAEIDFRDRFVAEKIIPVIEELRRHGQGVRRKGTIWDLRHSDLSDLTITTLRDVFQLANPTGARVQPLRIACLVSNPTDAHILKLWAEGFDDDKPYSRRWFFCRSEALAWIHEADAVARPVADDGQATAAAAAG